MAPGAIELRVNLRYALDTRFVSHSGVSRPFVGELYPPYISSPALNNYVICTGIQDHFSPL